MTYAPILAGTGVTAWAMLKRTQASQTATLAAQPEIKREDAYFREKIGQVTTAEQLVSDRRLLKVALETFGLEGDLNNRYFIQKVLEGGTLKTDALAVKLSDKRYTELSAAFGFGDYKTPRTKLSDFADTILTQWKNRRFETAVGDQDNNLRLAMNAQRELEKLAAKTSSDKTLWFTVMGNAPLRSVMQAALGLPAKVAALDVDQQLTIFQSRAEAVFGDSTVKQFASAEKREALAKRFLTLSQAASQTSTNPVLTLLQGAVFRRI